MNTKIISVYLFIFLSLLVVKITVADEVTLKANQVDIIQPAGNNTAFQQTITQLEKASEGRNKKLQDYVTALPVNKENVEVIIAKLQQKVVIQNQIDQVGKIIDGLADYLKAEEKSLQSAKQTRITLLERVMGIEETLQVVSNPLNELGMTEADKIALTLDYENSETTLEKFTRYIRTVEENIKATTQKLTLANRWSGALQERFQQQSNVSYLDDKQDDFEEQRLVKKQKGYAQIVKETQNKLEKDRNYLSLEEIGLLQNTLFYNKNMVWLTGVDIDLINQFRSDDINIAKNPIIMKEKSVDKLERVLTSLGKTTALLNKKAEQIKVRKAKSERRSGLTTSSNTELDLNKEISIREQRVSSQLLSLEVLPSQVRVLIEKKKKENLYSRGNLYKLGSLAVIKTHLLSSPVLIFYQIEISFSLLYQYIVENPLYLLLLSLLSALTLFGVAKILSHYVGFYNKAQEQPQVGILHNLQKLAYIVHDNAVKILLIVFFLSFVRLSAIPFPSDAILLLLARVLFFIILWVSFISLEVKNKNIYPALALQAKVAGVVFILMLSLFLLSDLSLAAEQVVLFYEKLLFISAIYLTLVVKRLVGHYWRDYKGNEHSFIVRKLRFIIHILPWVIIALLIIGIVDYGVLAWTLIKYILAVVVFSLVVFYGITAINDLRKYLKIYCIRRFKHGSFIAQDIVSPFSNILKIVWWFLAAVVLFTLFGWNENSYLVAKLVKIIDYPIYQLDSIKVTLNNIFFLVLFIYLIFKAGKWFKSVSYRWFYVGIGDLGVRNSLATFSQYIIITVGFLVTLNLLGFDLTTLTVFAGALGVGVGLGLQDIAKNFISGILLLIERPLRTGDTVTIDTTEGVVQRIGMRAITLETFDKEEVIIPNAAVINDGFTNWTHSNNILRTVLYVGADYASDPTKVVDILLQIINKQSEILKEPEPLAIAWEYGDSAINYRLQYYLDVEASSLLMVRHHILNAIWCEFKANGISIPFPQRDLHINQNFLGGEPPKME